MTTAMIHEIPRRYFEQIQTTVETMRRRGLSIYDGVFRFENRFIVFIEKIREIIEPTAYDIRDFVISAMNNTDALPQDNKDFRNSLLELYLGITVLMVGVSAGIISGATFVGSLLSILMSPLYEIGLLVVIPGYTFYQLKVDGGLDETEHRVWLFGVAFFTGSIFGHALGDRLLSTVPSVIFILPLTLALLIDYELGPKNLFVDRQRLLVTATGIGGIIAYLFSYFIIGFAVVPIFAISVALTKSQTITSTDLQFGYILATLLVQVIVSIFFGKSQFGKIQS